MLYLMFVRFYRCRRCNARFSQIQIVWDRRTIFLLTTMVVVAIAFSFGSAWVAKSPYVSIKSWVRGIIRNTHIYTPKGEERGTLLKDGGVSEGRSREDLRR